MAFLRYVQMIPVDEGLASFQCIEDVSCMVCCGKLAENIENW